MQTGFKLTAIAALGLVLTGCSHLEKRAGQIGDFASSTFSSATCETVENGADTAGKSSWPADCKNIDQLVLAEGIPAIEYYLIKEGPETADSPTMQSVVQAHYEGRRVADGHIIDSSYARGEPTKFPVNGVIPGWSAILQTMRIGDDIMVKIPAVLAYGDKQRSDDIPPNTDLVFRIELLDIEGPRKSNAAPVVEKTPEAAPQETVETAAPAAPSPKPKLTSSTAAWRENLPWKPLGPKTIRTGSGLSFIIIDSGAPDGTSPTPLDNVRAHYEGRLAKDGTLFDSSFQRGEPAVFPANGVIQGWREALSLMVPGDRWLINLPPELAYGAEGTESGTIGPNEALMFEIWLLDVLPAE